ncbi:MAG: hypothetical protein ACOC6M_04110 [Halobacteriota archaeon]
MSGAQQVKLRDILRLVRWSRVTVFTGLYLIFAGFLTAIAGNAMGIDSIDYASAVIFTGFGMCFIGLAWISFKG